MGTLYTILTDRGHVVEDDVTPERLHALRSAWLPYWKVREKRPIVRRFIIKRHPLALATRSPWVLRDRSRPAYLGHFATHALALTAVDRKLADERGYVPSVAEIREAMTTGAPAFAMAVVEATS